jgi:hypothetical protein
VKMLELIFERPIRSRLPFLLGCLGNMVRLILPGSLKLVAIDTCAVPNPDASLAGRLGLIALERRRNQHYAFGAAQELIWQ